MDFIEIPQDLKRSNCLEWNTRYDKFNFLYLYIRHLFPETASITDFRQMPIKYLKKFNIKGIYWMTIISFIFHFTRDLVFMPERSEGIIKVPRKVKNKGYESHPIRNFA